MTAVAAIPRKPGSEVRRDEKAAQGTEHSRKNADGKDHGSMVKSQLGTKNRQVKLYSAC